MFRKASNAERFDRIRESATEVWLPFIVTEDQYKRFVIDYRRCLKRRKLRKIMAAFGGNRSGKSQIGASLLVDMILIYGGPGAQFWWVSKTRELTRLAIEKLVEGQKTNRVVRPLLPADLVFNYPVSEDSPRQWIQLIDGTQIHLKYASKKGGNLKGRNCMAILVDEGCEIDDIKNWTICLNRTMDTGGTVMVSTTPVAGHWLKTEVADRGKNYLQIEDSDEILCDSLSCFDNSFIHPDEVQRTLEATTDERTRDREVFGLWVPEGNVLWSNWSDKLILSGRGETCESWGYERITEYVARKSWTFKRADTDLSHIGGQDFNVSPMSLIDIEVGIRPGCDPANHLNWHFFAMREVVTDGLTIQAFTDYLTNEAHKEHKLPASHFAGMAIAGDPSAAHKNPPQGHGLGSMSLLRYMQRNGFPYAKECNRSKGGKPHNPAQLDRLNLVHGLMFTQRLHVHMRCTRLIRAFETQEARPDGRIDKESGKASDKASGPSDGLCYGLWALYSEFDPALNRKKRAA
ncbi:MAG: terminase family protein [Myxococcota bacterium]